MNTKLIRLLIIFVIFSNSLLFAQIQDMSSEKAQEAYKRPNILEPDELFERAKKCLDEGLYDDARLYALRMYFDGNRNINVINILGMIETEAGRPLLGAEWFRKASSLSLNNKVAQKYLARLPQKPRAIPVDPEKLPDHFNEIAEGLPKLLLKLTNEKIHYEAVLKALERGQIYLALALAEEYENRYPKSADGAGLSALSAWYLGRDAEAVKIIEENLKKSPYNSLLLFVKAMIFDTNVATASGNYFKALYNFDQWEKALELSEQYSKQFPNSPDAYITQARILLDLHKTKEAGEALQEAGKRDPGNPEVEALWVHYLLQKDDTEKAARRLVNAFKRGYNLPSVNLTAGIFALQGGRVDEVNLIIEEATACLPFCELEAYPMYISLVLTVNKLEEARKALDYWKPCSAEKSMYCYMEALYYFKRNYLSEGVKWLRKAFNLNPHRIDVLRFFIALPTLEQEDKNLYAQINNKLSEMIKGFITMKVPERIIHKPAPEQKYAAAAPLGAPVVAGNFKLTTGEDINGRDTILEELNEMYKRVAPKIGTLKEPINVKFVSAENLGPMIVNYDSSKDIITMTSNYYDSEMIRNIVLANFDAITEEEKTALIEEFPKHLLASAICKYMIHHMYPATKNAKDKNSWMLVGLSEIMADGTYSLRYRLHVAQKSITEKSAKLSSLNMINSIFNEGYSTPAIFETATAQAYLMTCYLVKKDGLSKGSKKMIELLNKVSSGSDFEASLKDVFNISVSDFEKGWTEAGNWAISQGSPYEWK